MDAEEQEDVRRDFGEAVNMTPSDLEKWLESDESLSVGEGSGESKGHASGRRIVELLRSKKDDLSTSDYEHMRKVVGFVRRHLAQRPSGDIENTDWRYSLMNWGHDPTKS